MTAQIEVGSVNVGEVILCDVFSVALLSHILYSLPSVFI